MTSTATPVVTKQDVAAAANVTVRTVERVINDPGLVGDAARKAVLEAIEATGFTGQHLPRGRRPSKVPLVHPVAPKVDERTRDEMARRGQVLTTAHGPRLRGWDAELVRLALDWAFNPPEGVAPMPDDYLGFVDRTTSP